jgi:hypothetical protein
MDESRYPQYAFLHHSFLNQTLTLLAYSHGGAVLLNSQAVRSRNQKDTLSTSQFRPAKCAFSPACLPDTHSSVDSSLSSKLRLSEGQSEASSEKRGFSRPSFSLPSPSCSLPPSFDPQNSLLSSLAAPERVRKPTTRRRCQFPRRSSKSDEEKGKKSM